VRVTNKTSYTVFQFEIAWRNNTLIFLKSFIWDEIMKNNVPALIKCNAIQWQAWKTGNILASLTVKEFYKILSTYMQSPWILRLKMGHSRCSIVALSKIYQRKLRIQLEHNNCFVLRYRRCEIESISYKVKIRGFFWPGWKKYIWLIEW
jgi:hypothetical protein